MLAPTANRSSLKVGIIRSSSIGDVVLATACVDFLDKLNVDAKVVWASKPPALGLLKASFPNIQVLDLSGKDGPSLSLILSEMHFVLDLQKSMRTHWMCRSLEKLYDTPVFTYNKSILKRSRLVLESRIRGRSSPLPESTSALDRHQYEMMLDALRQGIKWQLPLEALDGIDKIESRPILPLPKFGEQTPAWYKELSHGQWLAVAPGASYSSKRAPADRFIEILDQTVQMLAAQGLDCPQLVFVGDNADRTIATSLLDRLVWRQPTLNLAGKLSLAESAKALSLSSHLLCNDSSLAHMAEAVDTSVSVLFGPTVEAFGFAPRKPESKAFSARLGCRPCSKHGASECRYADLKCFWDIPAQAVAEHVAASLSGDE